jgi:hypothetical protein
MNDEIQALIVRRQPPVGHLFYDALNENFLKFINTVGTVNGLTSTYGAVFLCKNPEDQTCLTNITKISLYAGFGTAYAIGILKILAHSAPKSFHLKFFKISNLVLDQAMQILGNHNFYLLAGNSIAAAIARSDEIPDAVFWSAVFLPVLAFTLFSHTPAIRYQIRESCCKYPFHAERGGTMKAIDMATGFLNGATMVTTISGISQVHDAVNQLDRSSPDSWVYSPEGMAARYTLGGLWGAFQCGLRYFYPAYFTEDAIVKSRWPSVLQSVLDVVTLMMLTAFSISSLNSNDPRRSEPTDFMVVIILSVLLLSIGAVMTGVNFYTSLKQEVKSSRDAENPGNFSPITVSHEVAAERDSDEQVLPTEEHETEEAPSERETNLVQDTVTQMKQTAPTFSFKVRKGLNKLLFYKNPQVSPTTASHSVPAITVDYAR